MKKTPFILSSVALAGLTACATLNAPMSGSGVDPLAPPGSGMSTMAADPGGSLYAPGTFVQSAIDNTAFYKVRPKGNEEADKLLNQHTSMKIISVAGSYVKVELDSGEIGFVPSVMVEDPNFSAGLGTDMMADPGELPLFDANDLPPEGSIPPVIDPDMPLPDFPEPLADDGSLPSADGSTPASELPAADGSIDALGGGVEVKVEGADATAVTPPSSSPETKAALQEAALGDGPKEKEE